jgi:hypothetical protein
MFKEKVGILHQKFSWERHFSIGACRFLELDTIPASWYGVC